MRDDRSEAPMKALDRIALAVAGIAIVVGFAGSSPAGSERAAAPAIGQSDARCDRGGGAPSAGEDARGLPRTDQGRPREREVRHEDRDQVDASCEEDWVDEAP